jgi:hypothetical protein
MNALMKYCCLAFIFLQIAAVSTLAQSVSINEIMTSNVNTIRDEDGDSSDWVELFNNTSSPVNLQNWSITDDSLEINKWVFPAVAIQPGEFLIVFASDKDRKEGPYLHTSFRLGAGRESVFLYNSGGQKEDEFRAVCIPSNFSFGNKPDGSSKNPLYRSFSRKKQ